MRSLTVLAIKRTIDKKPTAVIIENDMSLFLINFKIPLVDFAFKPQI